MSASAQLWMDEVERIVEEYCVAACNSDSGHDVGEARERALGKLVAHGFDLQEANDQLDEATA